MGLEDLLSSITGSDTFGGGMNASDLFNNAYGASSLLPGETGGQPDQSLIDQMIGTGGGQSSDTSGGYNSILDVLGEPGQGGAGPSGDPITGIGWLDNILHGIGNSFSEHPLSTIQGALGILSAIDSMRRGNSSPGQGMMSELVRNHAASQGGGAAPAAIEKPFGFTGAQLLSIPQVKPYTGPLTNTFYNGKR